MTDLQIVLVSMIGGTAITSTVMLVVLNRLITSVTSLTTVIGSMKKTIAAIDRQTAVIHKAADNIQYLTSAVGSQTQELRSGKIATELDEISQAQNRLAREQF